MPPNFTIRPDTTDDWVFNQIYNKDALDIHCPGKVDLILDLGAYTGISTRWYCDRYPDAAVIAVEPEPEACSLIKKHAPGASVLQAAVAGENGTATLRASEKGEWAYNTRHNSDGEEIASVPALTVDTILGSWVPQIVKIDIEGAEKEVFEAGGEWLNNVTLLLVETHDRFLPGCSKALTDALESTGRPWRWKSRKGASGDRAVLFLDD